jgi:thiol-disulfide isomerase/thioredoxin
MRFIWVFCIGFLFSNSAAQAQQVAVYKTYDELANRISAQSDTTFVINFWATWCKPCVEELPIFDALALRSAGKPVKILLISLDFERQIERHLVPFLREKKLAHEVILLADKDVNKWMARVDEKWDGAIPATLFAHGSKTYFARTQFKSVSDLDMYLQAVK